MTVIPLLVARTIRSQCVRRTWWGLVLTARRRVATPCRSSAEHAATKLFRDRAFVDQKIRRRRGQCRRGPDRYGFFGERGENRLELPYVEIRRLWPLLSSRSSSRAFYSRLQARPRPPRPGP